MDLVSRDEGNIRVLVAAQTLVRGLDVLCVVAGGTWNLPELAEAVGLPKSTTHRLATSLVEQRFLNFAPRVGYSLGPKLLELGHIASRQMNLSVVAHEFLVELATSTGDTVHLGILDDDRVLYLDKVSGSRRVDVSSRIGERQPLRPTGLGKALLLDHPIRWLAEVYERESRSFPDYSVPLDDWFQRMKDYARLGYAFDLAENEDGIRCVAAPVRGADDAIIGAISVSSAAQYMDHERMLSLTRNVTQAAARISREFGWTRSASRA